MAQNIEQNNNVNGTNTENLKFTTMGIMCISLEGEILDVNDDALELLGYTDSTSVLQKSISEYIFEGNQEQLKSELSAAVTDNATKSAYMFFELPNKDLLKAEVAITPWLNDKYSNKVLLIIKPVKIVNTNERTNLVSYDKALESFKNLISNDEDEELEADEVLSSPFPRIWMFAIDEKGTCKSWNKYFEHYFGFTAEDVIDKKSLFDLIDPAQPGGTTVILKAALASEKIFKADIKLPPKSGSKITRWGHITITKCLDYKGKNSGYIVIFYPLGNNEEEIDEKTETTDLLIGAEELSSTYDESIPIAQEVGEQLPAAVPISSIEDAPIDLGGSSLNLTQYDDLAIVSSSGDIKFITNNFVKQLGFTSVDEIREHNWFEFLNDGHKDMEKTYTGSDNGFSKPIKIPYKTREGTILETEFQVIPIPNSSGRYTDALWLIHRDGLHPDGPLYPDQPGVDPKPRIPPDGPERPPPGPNEYEAALLQLNQDLAALNIIADVIEQYTDFDEMVKTALDVLAGVISIEYCGLFLLKDDSAQFYYSLGENKGIDTISLGDSSNSDSVIELIENTFKGSIRDIVRTNLIVPIQSNGNCLGYLALAGSVEADFTNMDMELINTASHQLAGAIKRKELIEDYNKLQHNYNSIFNGSSDIYFTIDAEAKIGNYNDRSKEVFGFENKKIIGKNISKVLKPNLRNYYKIFNEWIIKSLSSRNFSSSDLSLELNSGETRFYNVQLKEIEENDAGPASEIRVILRDITEHHRLMTHLRSANEIMEQIFNATSEVVIYIDASKTIIECNNSVENMLGYKQEEMRGNSANILYANDLLMEKYFSQLEEVYRTNEKVTGEQVIRRKDGTMLVANVTATPVKNSLDELIGMTLYLTDITTRKKEGRELIEAKKESKLYINILSHDVTNYNECALSYLGLLKKMELEPQQKNYIDIVIDQIERVKKLSSNIKMLSDIKENRSKLKTVDLNKVLRDNAFTLLEKSLTNNNYGELDLKFNYPEGLYGIKADKLIDELFSNIFWNAIQHNSHEKKLLEISIKKPKDNSDAYWQVEISDNAFGIPDEEKTTIFNPQLCNSNSDENSRLGLSIISALVERYGGKVWVENRVLDDYKKGSIFKLLLEKSGLSISEGVYGFGARV